MRASTVTVSTMRTSTVRDVNYESINRIRVSTMRTSAVRDVNYDVNYESIKRKSMRCVDAGVVTCVLALLRFLARGIAETATNAVKNRERWGGKTCRAGVQIRT